MTAITNYNQATSHAPKKQIRPILPNPAERKTQEFLTAEDFFRPKRDTTCKMLNTKDEEDAWKLWDWEMADRAWDMENERGVTLELYDKQR
ncbi:Protein of unknown function [Pyronema omphalodes CBS 100304]|uniref:Uncharacterized protein n=1 Tax=Pyronema omphalodes (strain CBS 100304) TaxID=1076935 RepID=U4LE39_PYROM|nr:Protein of unknown function [Pyronema omphalodes CBS 100304]